MARAGRAAEALGLVLLAALFGGFLSLLFMVAVAEPFASDRGQAVDGRVSSR